MASLTRNLTPWLAVVARRPMRLTPPQPLQASPIATRLLHSKSSYGRGRAAIRASVPRRRTAGSPRKTDTDKGKDKDDSSASSSSWFPFGSSSSSAAATSSRASSSPAPSPADAQAAQLKHDAKMREASEAWPTWLPKTAALRAWEMEQERRGEVNSNESAGAGADSRSRPLSAEEVEGVFIRKDDPEHSSRRPQESKFDQQQSSGWQRTESSWSRPSSSSSSGQQQQKEWPWWLPPRPSPQRHSHPVFSLMRPSAHARRREFWEKNKLLILLIGGGGGAWYLLHLEQVPYTGRWRFMDVSEASEERAGQEAFAATMAEYRGRILPPNHPYSKMTRQVASRLIRAAADLHGLEFEGVEAGTQQDAAAAAVDKTYARDFVANTKWQVFVIDDRKTKNAFVLPGGQIFVFTGILPYCKDEDGLATVLSHEISHKLCRHTGEKMAGSKIFMGVGILIDGLLGVFGVGRWVTQLVLGLPNSRTLEEEADALGLRLMSRACFDPTAAPQLWQRMDQGDEGDSLGELFSTHPLSAKRMKTLQQQVPAAEQIHREAGCPTEAQRGAFTRAAWSRY